jgi:hypothetical protein
MGLISRRHKTDSDEKPRQAEHGGGYSGSLSSKLTSKLTAKHVQKLIVELNLRCQELGKMLLQTERDVQLWLKSNELTNLCLEEANLEKLLQNKLIDPKLCNDQQETSTKEVQIRKAEQPTGQDEGASALAEQLASIQKRIEEKESEYSGMISAAGVDSQSRPDEIQDKISDLNRLIDDIEIQEDLSTDPYDENKAESILLTLVQEIPKLAIALRDKENEVLMAREEGIKHQRSLRQYRQLPPCQTLAYSAGGAGWHRMDTPHHEREISLPLQYDRFDSVLKAAQAQSMNYQHQITSLQSLLDILIACIDLQQESAGMKNLIAHDISSKKVKSRRLGQSGDNELKTWSEKLAHLQEMLQYLRTQAINTDSSNTQAQVILTEKIDNKGKVISSRLEGGLSIDPRSELTAKNQVDFRDNETVQETGVLEEADRWLVRAQSRLQDWYDEIESLLAQFAVYFSKNDMKNPSHPSSKSMDKSDQNTEDLVKSHLALPISPLTKIHPEGHIIPSESTNLAGEMASLDSISLQIDPKVFSLTLSPSSDNHFAVEKAHLLTKIEILNEKLAEQTSAIETREAEWTSKAAQIAELTSALTVANAGSLLLTRLQEHATSDGSSFIEQRYNSHAIAR